MESEIITRLLDVSGPRSTHHPLFEEGNKSIKLFKKFGICENDNEDFLHEPVLTFSCNIFGCKRKFDTVFEFEQHYNCSHRYTCAECKKVLATAHLLDLHISETHDSFFKTLSERKPMFQCYLEDCKVVCETPQLRKSHCLEFHNFPSNFWCDKDVSKGKTVPKKKQNTTAKQKPKGNIEEKMELEPTTKGEKQKYLGHMGSKSRQKILINFAKDLADSLPTTQNNIEKNCNKMEQ